MPRPLSVQERAAAYEAERSEGVAPDQLERHYDGLRADERLTFWDLVDEMRPHPFDNLHESYWGARAVVS